MEAEVRRKVCFTQLQHVRHRSTDKFLPGVRVGGGGGGLWGAQFFFGLPKKPPPP